MKAKFVVYCVLALALIGLSCTPEATLEISVTEIDYGVLVVNVGNVDCLVFVTSPEGEQQFQLAAGKNQTVTNISKPVKVSAVKLATG